MSRIQKHERITVIAKTLTENPEKIYTLNYFGELLSCAKSTLSEDLDIIRNAFEMFQLGQIDTIAGAAGGVVYRPTMDPSQVREFCDQLSELIAKEERFIPGGYIYLNDILYSPELSYRVGKALANCFHDKEVDYVVTIETKGIPIALMTARALNKPMIVVRKESRLTEGTAIHMNYVSGSSKRIQTMSLAKRSIAKNAKVIFIDDFMKAGGTARGIIDLMKEFEAEVVGVGVLMATKEPKEKLVDNYQALVLLEDIDQETKQIKVYPYSQNEI